MSESIQIKVSDDPTPTGESPFKWGPGTPRGAKAVFTRIIKEGANVPLFIGQTLVNALRDLGYNETTAAICEFVDNSVQWGAKEVRVYFNETGRLPRLVGHGLGQGRRWRGGFSYSLRA